MKRILLAISLVGSLSIVVQASENQSEEEQAVLNCYETILSLSPSMSSNLECVQQSSIDDFDFLCDNGGVLKTKEFERYITYKDAYDFVLSEIDEYFKENPGAVQTPRRLAAKLTTAEVAWKGPGKKTYVENSIEKLRRNSVGCKDD